MSLTGHNYINCQSAKKCKINKQQQNNEMQTLPSSWDLH